MRLRIVTGENMETEGITPIFVCIEDIHIRTWFEGPKNVPVNCF